jgi:hypothetical protein
MLTLFVKSGMKPELVDQKRTGIPDLMISEGVTIYTHISSNPEPAPYSLGAVPSLPTDTPEEKAWLAARTFTAAFFAWDVDASPRNISDFEAGPMSAFPNRDALFVQVGARPTWRLWQMQAIEERDSKQGRPRPPIVLDKKP